MIDKILIKLTGLILVAVSIFLVIEVIIIDDYYDLLALACWVVIITTAIISLILGISFLIAKVSKKTTTIEVNEVEEE